MRVLNNKNSVKRDKGKVKETSTLQTLERSNRNQQIVDRFEGAVVSGEYQAEAPPLPIRRTRLRRHQRRKLQDVPTGKRSHYCNVDDQVPAEGQDIPDRPGGAEEEDTLYR